MGCTFTVNTVPKNPPQYLEPGQSQNNPQLSKAEAPPSSQNHIIPVISSISHHKPRINVDPCDTVIRYDSKNSFKRHRLTSIKNVNYVQNDLTQVHIDEGTGEKTFGFNPIYGENKDPIEFCKKLCVEKGENCFGFFYSHHPNGHEIVAFYTEKSTFDSFSFAVFWLLTFQLYPLVFPQVRGTFRKKKEQRKKKKSKTKHIGKNKENFVCDPLNTFTFVYEKVIPRGYTDYYIQVLGNTKGKKKGIFPHLTKTSQGVLLTKEKPHLPLLKTPPLSTKHLPPIPLQRRTYHITIPNIPLKNTLVISCQMQITSKLSLLK